MKDMIRDRMEEVYGSKVENFFRKIEQVGFSDAELQAVPSLFLPGWGENYGSTRLKVAIIGKETLGWSTQHGSKLYDDVSAHKSNSYDVISSCLRFREEGPAVWQNNFWQYAITVLAKVFSVTKDDMMLGTNRLLKSFVWFNSHSIETYGSKTVNHSNILRERMDVIQQIADECKLNELDDFLDVFLPDVILYFYRNNSGVPDRIIPSFLKQHDRWGNGEDVYEYQGKKIILLQLRHPTYNAYNGISEDYIAGLVDKILYVRDMKEIDRTYDVYSMNASEWRWWVDYVRNVAESEKSDNLNEIARNLIKHVAHELQSRNSRMTAQTLVQILNEVDIFRVNNWMYSPERRGPCSVVRGAYNASDNEDSAVIASAFTKLNGELAWK